MVASKSLNSKAKTLKLKRIFKMGSALLIYSIVPILSWIVLSLIYKDSRIENVFSITYPMQFAWSVAVALFGTAANIRANKEQNENHIYSSAFWGIIFSAIVFVVPTIFADNYIAFFGQEPEIYKDYVIYAFVLTILQVIFSLVVEKLYFEDKEKQANLHLFIFNLTNFAVLVISNLIFMNFVISMIITLSVLFVYVAVLCILNFKKFKIDFSFCGNFKYESANIVSYIMMFLIYFFGLKNAFCAWPEYVLALTTVSLCNDAFWDSMGAISKIAKIDLSKKRYNYKQEIKNASIYTAILIAISCASTIGLTFLNGAKLPIVIVYLSFQVFDMACDPFRQIMSTYTQLEYSPRLNTIINFIYKGIRVCLSVFIISPYCTEIGQVSQGLLLLISYIVIRAVKYKVVDGKLCTKKPTEEVWDKSEGQIEEEKTGKTIDNNNI